MTDTTITTTDATTYEKGSWQATLADSEKKREAGVKAGKRAGELLWVGAQAAVNDWLPNAADDVSAEGLYNEAMTALGGKHRKGDASKIKTVAVAVKNHGLDMNRFVNLSKAYAEAKRLTVTVANEKAEDEAAEAAVKSLADEAPNSASTPENAAKIVLSAGLDEAARLLLDALGASNDSAHRSFMRAISQEIAGRVKPKTPAKPKGGPKKGAKQATSTGPSPKAAVKTATTKPKAKAGEATKAKPVSASKGDPNKKALPRKATPVKAAPKGEPVDGPVEAGAEHVEAATPAKKKAKPVAVRR